MHEALMGTSKRKIWTYSSLNKMFGGLCRSIFVGNGYNRPRSKGVYTRTAVVSWILNFLGSKENGSG